MIIEMKTRWVLDGSDIEIYGYVLQNKLYYGVLSTYDNTWFIKVSDNKELYISPPRQTRRYKFNAFSMLCVLYFKSKRKPYERTSSPKRKKKTTRAI